MGKRIYWALARATFLFFTLTFGASFIGMYLTAPLWSWYFFGSLCFWKYLKFFPGICRNGYKLLYMSLFHPEYTFVTRLRLDDPPRLQPDPDTIELQPSWDGPLEDCNGCHKCCLHVTCPLLDKETGLCHSYNTFYWRYFNCGRFPVNQAHLDYFDCPKWQMKSCVPHRQ